MKQRIICALAADHRGFRLKEEIKALLAQRDLEVMDCGVHNEERSDYPAGAQAVVHALLSDQASRGILLCGSGIGMAIAANRVPGIRAGLVWNADVTRMARADDDITVLVLPADFITSEEAHACVEAFLDTQAKGGRYAQRLEMLETLMADECAVNKQEKQRP
jgi:ribose 5-phosphate isomerase B